MKLLPDKNTLKLLRLPFSFLLMPIFLLALSQATQVNSIKSLISFLLIHLLVYPASNGYNSYIDKDVGSIGGLEKPPMPSQNLFDLTLAMDVSAIIIGGIFVNLNFATLILLYILASRAYSSKLIRLKQYPILGFLTVVVFQGGYTYVMCSAGISDVDFNFSKINLFLLLACSLQIAGIYPLTQIYQHDQDFKDGVVTLSYRLGYRGTFVFTGLMFLICNIFYFGYFFQLDQVSMFYLLQLFFLPIVLYFSYWFYQVIQDPSAANYKNTMRMNLIAALFMNLCFILFNFKSLL